MTFLRRQIAWAILGALLSGVWWLLTHAGHTAPSPAARPDTSALSLSTPATVVLAGGEVIRGAVTGAQALCPSWADTLAAGGVTVTLPDGRRIPGDEVRSVAVTPATLDGLAALVTTTACGDALTLHPLTTPPP
ncbi:hypothetical protein HNQ07_002708 [Deinococcus metalli]|uniref:Uncharacterized protein n=1 Tax=Deinococcus metalli TaxID=1141878 RepID=A0A7W8KG11_9DEIO|nr:hypothetical protein [Deinococcus metalli]MBB5377235.1 hypothetical protein [Deinococcus metalli]GHF47984.1 hypothetical protein GCM10017781_25410 [Deinococcus metalli]